MSDAGKAMPGGAQDPAIRARAAMAFVRGVSPKKSWAAATTPNVEPRFMGTLIEWERLLTELTDAELGAASYAYMSTWNDVPLAAKKRRVEELATLYARLSTRLAKVEDAERVAGRAAKRANDALAAAGRVPNKLPHGRSAEWVRTAAEMRAVLRDIALEMGEDKLLDRLADRLAEVQAQAASGPEALVELRALLDMETERRAKAGRAVDDADAEPKGDG